MTQSPEFASKVDVHVHSKHSDRPSEWFLRRIGAPESFVEPMEVYRRAKERGMDFVTISDHNCIEGALEIAHLDGVFLSNEITTYFPEDGCKLHLLVLGIDEEQFRFIQELRPNVYELRDYLVREDIVHSLAHPFFRVNARLSPIHVEKLILLFNRFEGLNGSRDRRASELANVVFRNLTPEWVDRAAERHGIEPVGDQPWVKTFTGGSDDHSGLYVANAYTMTPAASSVEDWLGHVRAGRHDFGGEAGSSLRLAHSFYAIAYQYYRTRLAESGTGGPDLVSELFERLIHEREEKPSMASRVRGALGRSALRRNGSETERQLIDQLSSLAARADESSGAEGQGRDLGRVGTRGADWRTFQRASRVAQLVGFDFFDRLSQNLTSGKLLDACQAFASLAPVGLGIAPYLTSFATQHKDEGFLREVAGHFPWAEEYRQKTGRICWMTDTFGDVNGVAKMIQILGEEAVRQDIDLEVLTCEQKGDGRSWRKNFQPVGTFRLPEYAAQQLAFPPFLEIAEYIESRGFDEIIVSTPGPMGLLGLLCAKLLGLRTVGIYHTDFPAYVEALTENRALVGITRSFMLWFYDQMDVVEVPSEAYRRLLVEAGFPGDKLRLLRRGVDTRRFDPEHRDGSFWQRFEASSGSAGSDREPLRLLTVSRLSNEKNLHHLLRELRLLEDREWVLYMVGDGPARDELERVAEDLPVVFTGFLEGDDLAKAFASADLFVFPSVTDTFGNVVLEAQASGLPCVVSKQGGPAEIIVSGKTGLSASTASCGPFAQAIRLLAEDEDLRGEMSRLARIHALGFSWAEVVRVLAGRDGAGRRVVNDEPVAFGYRKTASRPIAVSWANEGVTRRESGRRAG